MGIYATSFSNHKVRNCVIFSESIPILSEKITPHIMNTPPVVPVLVKTVPITQELDTIIKEITENKIGSRSSIITAYVQENLELLLITNMVINFVRLVPHGKISYTAVARILV